MNKGNIVSFNDAAAKKNMAKLSEVSDAKQARLLFELQRLSNLKGSAGKIPDSQTQRAQWAKNVSKILTELKQTGFGISDLYNAGSEKFLGTYEDPQAYSKNLSAMQKHGSKKHLVGYKKYLEFIELVSRLTGDDMTRLAGRLTEGISFSSEFAAIPEGCYELAKKLEIIANRVGRQKGLVDKFQELACLREEHLCAGGSCVWPDTEWNFEEGIYTPMPGKRLGDGPWFGDLQCELMGPDYDELSVSELRENPDDSPAVRDGKRDFRKMYIENPALRRLGRNAFYCDSEVADDDIRSATTTTGKLMTISPYSGAAF